MRKLIVVFLIILAALVGYYGREFLSGIADPGENQITVPKLSPEETKRAESLEKDTKVKVVIRTIQVELMDIKQKNGMYPKSLPPIPTDLYSSFSQNEIMEYVKHFEYRSIQNGASYEITANLVSGKEIYTPSLLAH
ncbi:MAG: hypothetical protein AAB710_00955 [Patescibacteria group bacterium]